MSSLSKPRVILQVWRGLSMYPSMHRTENPRTRGEGPVGGVKTNGVWSSEWQKGFLGVNTVHLPSQWTYLREVGKRTTVIRTKETEGWHTKGFLLRNDDHLYDNRSGYLQLPSSVHSTFKGEFRQ